MTVGALAWIGKLSHKQLQQTKNLTRVMNATVAMPYPLKGERQRGFFEDISTA